MNVDCSIKLWRFPNEWNVQAAIIWIPYDNEKHAKIQFEMFMQSYGQNASKQMFKKKTMNDILSRFFVSNINCVYISMLSSPSSFVIFQYDSWRASIQTIFSRLTVNTVF